jgi:hypothetical protein
MMDVSRQFFDPIECSISPPPGFFELMFGCGWWKSMGNLRLNQHFMESFLISTMRKPITNLKILVLQLVLQLRVSANLPSAIAKQATNFEGKALTFDNATPHKVRTSS